MTETSDEYINDFAEVEKIRVFYVDYGLSHTVDMISIREIKPTFLQLPFQAVECSLGRVMPIREGCIRNDLPNGKWPFETSQKFRQLTSSSYRLRAKVLSVFGNRLELDLDYDKGGMDNWTNIADELISENLAAPCKVCKLQASITDYLLLDVPAVLPLVGAQLSLSQPGGQIMPTTLLLAHPDLKSQRHLCPGLAI